LNLPFEGGLGWTPYGNIGLNVSWPRLAGRHPRRCYFCTSFTLVENGIFLIYNEIQAV